MKAITLLRSARPAPFTHRITNRLLELRPLKALQHSPCTRQNTHPPSSRTFTTTAPTNMSFSNTDTGSKPQDPYKEKNKDETSLREKIEDLVAFMEKCKFAMMTTRIDSSGLLVSRCMALAAKESGGIDLLFHTNTESGKTDDLKSDPVTNIAFLNSSGEWASISGKATISTDRSLVHKHYSPSLKAWMGDLGDGKHDGGPDDPRIGIIWVKAVTATYAITNQSFMSRGFEIAKGTVTGEAAKVNKLREVSKEELAEWRKIHTK